MHTIGPLADSGTHACGNCSWRGPASDLRPIANIAQRIDPGGTVPSGECPQCGALAYPLEEDGGTKRRFVFVIHGAIEPGKVIGPVRDADHEEEIILDLMRNNSELTVQSRADAVFSLEIRENERPVVNSFSAAYLDGLRERVWTEHPEKWEP